MCCRVNIADACRISQNKARYLHCEAAIYSTGRNVIRAFASSDVNNLILQSLSSLAIERLDIERPTDSGKSSTPHRLHQKDSDNTGVSRRLDFKAYETARMKLCEERRERKRIYATAQSAMCYIPRVDRK